MTDVDPASVVRGYLDDFRRAYANAEAAIEALPDSDQAFKEASALRDAAEACVGAAALLRARLAHRLHAAYRLSLAGLADRLSISKARADQLIRLARKQEAGKVDGGPDARAGEKT